MVAGSKEEINRTIKNSFQAEEKSSAFFIFKMIWSIRIMLLAVVSVSSVNSKHSVTEGFFRITASIKDSSIIRQLFFYTQEVHRVESFFQQPVNDTIEILLLDESEYRQLTLKQAIPDWGIALAVPEKNQIILQAGYRRTAGLPVSLREIFLHELAHILLQHKTSATAGNIPVWFNEGCAMRISGEPRMMTMLQNAVVTKSLIPFDDLENVLRYDPYKAELAYDQSYSAVGYLINRFGKDIIHAILNRMNPETDFSEAFQDATGISVYRFEKEWSENFYPISLFEWTRYAETILWFALIPLLFIIAWIMKKNYERRKKKEWESEDEQEEDSHLWRLHQSRDGFDDH